ncbi:Gfo/Idh/MocA family oxidoreductase [Candidatus Bipolaricaulota bacterium]|nr:Gfo/Idh/MocA family oxidoreductase [Candidatus Bipolaricaulota bacterium]
MLDQPVRWGVLGSARIARQEVIPALTKANNAELVAIASRDRANADQCARDFGIAKAYGDYMALLSDPEIEAVYIPLPNHLHSQYAMAAAEAGKHVLCEKPIAGSLADGIRMFDASEQHDVLLMEAFMYRFHPQTQRVLELVGSGLIGGPHLVRASHSFPLHLENRADDCRWNRETAGGCLNDVGIYCLDVAQLLFKSEPTSAFARAEYRAPHSAEVALHGIVEFSPNRALIFDCSFIDAHQGEYAVLGDRGRITAFRTFHPGRGRDVEIVVETGGESRIERIDAANEYRLEVEHFSSCIRSGTRPSIPRSASLQNLRIVEALQRSAQAGTRIRIDF